MRLTNYIGGKWVDPRQGKFASTVSPADRRQTIAEHPLSDASDVAAAVDAAQRALPAWRALPPPQRGHVLAEIAKRIVENIVALSQTLTLDEGKTLAESRNELVRAAEAFEFCAGETRRLAGETLPSESAGRLVLTLREPLGVVGLITPWNYPAQIAAWKIAPALAMGNTVVFKPSSLTPLISQRLVEIIAGELEKQADGVGVLNLVHGSGAQVGAALAAHPGVAAISFTGSVETGAALQAELGTRNAPALCEMGGKNPLVVLDDADLAFAAVSCVRGAFGNAGQRCTATSRVILHERIASAFVELLVAETKKLKVGNGTDPRSDVGPLVAQANVEAVERALAKAVSGGARVLAGGRRPEGLEQGAYFLPTVLDGVDPAAEIAQDEIFGPLVVVLRAKDDATALSLANGVRYGLSASVYTRDLNRALFFARGFEAGIVHVNSPTVGGETHVPFGGMKSTGNGGRERGSASIDFYTRWKTIYLDSQP